jgi:uncharacterized protein YegL
MKGEPIEAVKVGLETLIASLRSDPYALETVAISIITFDKEVKQILPLSDIASMVLPAIETPDSGPTHLGSAMELLCSCVDMEVQKTTSEQKGDYKPLLFLLTDGKPSDIQKYNQMIPEIQKRNFSSVIVCAAGPKADINILRSLSDKVFSLDTTDSSTFMPFFSWVSQSVSTESKSSGTTTPENLPPPPEELHRIID